MRALKAAVVVMGVMIVLGFAALIVIIVGRVSNRAPGTPAASSAPAANQPYAAPPIELPAGARIETIAAGSERIVLDIVLAGGDRQLVVIDPATGKKLGTIPLRAAP